MTPRKLMESLTENEDIMINALAMSLRNIKYGKGEFAFFGSYDELVGTLKFLVDNLEDCVSDGWNPMGQIIKDYKDMDAVEQDALTRLRSAVLGEVKAGLKLLANIDKAKESVEYQNIWKEKQNEKTLYQRTDEGQD